MATATLNTAKNTKCYLLELPAEMRLHIYEFVYGSSPVSIELSVHIELSVLGKTGVTRYTLNDSKNATSAQLSLQRTCRLIYEEAQPVFHNYTTCQFELVHWRVRTADTGTGHQGGFISYIGTASVIIDIENVERKDGKERDDVAQIAAGEFNALLKAFVSMSGAKRSRPLSLSYLGLDFHIVPRQEMMLEALTALKDLRCQKGVEVMLSCEAKAKDLKQAMDELVEHIGGRVVEW